MKVIFLDVDGVVATSFGPRVMSDRYYDFNHKCLNRLERILEAEPETRIVISSCWRLHRDVDELRAVFTMRKFKYPERIIDKTISIPYMDKEETGGICLPRLRGLEILQWLEKHEELTGEKIKQYIIKTWYTNGTDNKFLKPGEEIPENFYKGRVIKKK